VFVAAVGERMTKAAPRSADGLLVHPFSTERYLREITVPAPADARERFELAHSPMVVGGRTEQEFAESRRRARKQIAFYGSTPAYRTVLALHGWGEPGDESNGLSRTTDPSRWKHMGELVTDEVLNQFAIVVSTLVEPSFALDLVQSIRTYGGLEKR
jgi:hypothetical protein